ncbi:hypothetical protein D9M68_262910 [compost metagenome]
MRDCGLAASVGDQLLAHRRQPSGGRRAHAEVAQPKAQQGIGMCHGQGAQPCQVEFGKRVGIAAGACQRRQRGGCQFVDQCAGLGEMRGRLHHVDRQRRKGRHQRRQVRAQGIARIAVIGIGRVVDPLQCVGRAIGLDLGAGHIQPGAQQRHAAAAVQRAQRWHASHAGHAGTAEQPQQHGLDLVVLVVGKQQQARAAVGAHRRQRGIARAARGRFHALSRFGLHRYPPHEIADLPLRAQRCAEAVPVVGIRLQAVMDMQRHHARANAPLRRGRTGGMQQRD